MAMLIAWQTINAVRHPGSRRFTFGFLVVAPGLTIRDRLRVLQPNDPDSYYRSRELVPRDMLADLNRANIVITNYHAFMRREAQEISRGGRALLQGRGPELRTLETEGQMLQRVMPGLMGMKNVMAFNDEAHHCYREQPAEASDEDGSTSLQNGRLELFRNFDDYGNPLPRPHTLLIDSEQLDSGDALSKDFRVAATDEIERFRREIIERTGDRRQAESLSDQDLLREVMNTVGKADRLGGATRCVVSVSMLTEGWDARTVTHVLGVRAFGTQLLCEQVVGRALRRQSYDLNEEGLFNVEYADVLGIPFDFTADPIVVKPQKPRETVTVKAITPDRDACEIRFPRVQGYRVELPEEHVDAQFGEDSTFVLTPEIVGPSITHNAGIIGEGVDLSLIHRNDLRPSTLVYHLTKSAPTSRTMGWGWKCPTGTAPKHAPTSPTSSCWSMTARETTTCFTSWSRSRVSGARMPRRRRRPWIPTGYRA